MSTIQLQFEGAAQTVTGSQTLVRYNGSAILVDCGLYQGPKPMRLLNWNKPDFLDDVQCMIITHAHIDHSGLIPKWYQWGWRGPIYCTAPTADLLTIMLPDSARLQEEDARFARKTKHSKHSNPLPLYTEEEANAALRLVEPKSWEQWHNILSDLECRFMRSGHILGSAIVQLRRPNGKGTKKIITFSGDLGGGHSDILKPPEKIKESDVVVLESTYGDRKVEVEGREERLCNVINKVIGRGGTLVVPAFALGRAQDLLFSIYQLDQKKLIPDVPVYLDSPMANSVTKLYLKHVKELCLSSSEHHNGNHIEESLSTRFFNGVESPDDSMLLCMSDEPKIVLSASGMLQGGRVLHHLKSKLPHEKNGVLFVGYQGKDTKGRLLLDGIPSLRIHHFEVEIRAEIFNIDGYSAHGDADDLMDWLSFVKPKPSNLFLNHGEFEAQTVFAKRISDNLQIEAQVPALHQVFSV